MCLNSLCKAFRYFLIAVLNTYRTGCVKSTKISIRKTWGELNTRMRAWTFPRSASFHSLIREYKLRQDLQRWFPTVSMLFAVELFWSTTHTSWRVHLSVNWVLFSNLSGLWKLHETARIIGLIKEPSKVLLDNWKYHFLHIQAPLLPLTIWNGVTWSQSLTMRL